jgi:hypothetical protein
MLEALTVQRRLSHAASRLYMVYSAACASLNGYGVAASLHVVCLPCRGKAEHLASRHPVAAQLHAQTPRVRGYSRKTCHVHTHWHCS